jgi:RNA polymerase sigma factor (sigma-70 family)
MRNYHVKSGQGSMNNNAVQRTRPLGRSAVMQQRSDRELVAELAGSNKTTALGECLARYGCMVQRTARRITNDDHLAEDVCQAVFLVLLRKAASLAKVESLAAWLHRVAILAARNTVKVEMRRKKREERAAMVHEHVREPAAKLPTGIDQAIDRLPEVYRRVIVAHYLEGRPYAEVASRLGVSEETARMRSTRALERLRRSLAPTTAGLTVVALSSALTAEAAAASAAPPMAAAPLLAPAGAGLTASVSTLADATVKALFWAKMKIYAVAVAAAATLAVPAYVLLKPSDQGLVGHYTLSEGSGTVVKDASPSGNHGTLVSGGVAWAPGPKPGGKALSFDGKTGCVKLSRDLSPWLGSTATIAFWMKTTQKGVPSDGFAVPASVTGVDVAGGDVAVTTNDIQWGFIDETGRTGVCVGDPALSNRTKPLENILVRTVQPINDGQWRHIALTRDAATGRLEVFVDGKLNATTLTAATGRKTTPFSSIGRKEVVPEQTKPAYFFQGSLAEVRFYNRVLGPAEIAALAR